MKCVAGKQRTKQVSDSLEKGGFAVWTAACVLCLLFALHFLEQEKGFLSPFSEGRLQPI